MSKVFFCREEGIRTLDTLPYTRFPSVRLRPLGHLSLLSIQIHFDQHRRSFYFNNLTFSVYFFDKIINYDDYYNQLKHDAKSQGKTLKYIATFEPELDNISVKLCEIDSGHPFYNINGTNNVIAITTDIYDEPIVLQGYGAGKYQTASGVLNDILNIKLN